MAQVVFLCHAEAACRVEPCPCHGAQVTRSNPDEQSTRTAGALKGVMRIVSASDGASLEAALPIARALGQWIQVLGPDEMADHALSAYLAAYPENPETDGDILFVGPPEWARLLGAAVPQRGFRHLGMGTRVGSRQSGQREPV